jgi:hypothetical protein
VFSGSVHDMVVAGDALRLDRHLHRRISAVSHFAADRRDISPDS